MLQLNPYVRINKHLVLVLQIQWKECLFAKTKSIYFGFCKYQWKRLQRLIKDALMNKTEYIEYTQLFRVYEFKICQILVIPDNGK